MTEPQARTILTRWNLLFPNQGWELVSSEGGYGLKAVRALTTEEWAALLADWRQNPRLYPPVPESSWKR